MRSDLILNLAHAGIAGDGPGLKRTVRALAEEAAAKQQHTLAKRFSSLIEGREMGYVGQSARFSVPDNVRGLFHQIEPKRRFRDLLLPTGVVSELNDLVEEHRQLELLRSYSIEPRHTMLLQGAPGTGKTSLAEAVASELGLTLFVVRYDSIVGSYLGETAAKLNDLLEYAATTPCVLFFDEFDAIGKERGDIHETGEIKRVVSSLLLQLDSLPPHVFVICATNHPELLDRAVWRRFEIHFELPLPSKAQVQRWLKSFIRDIGAGEDVPVEKLVAAFAGVNYSDLELFSLDIKRRLILTKDPSYSKVFDQTVRKWSARLRAARRVNKVNGSQSTDSPDLFHQHD
ncbi:SpoVK/Ycf46/Vps4 family AAA+-type ATPase [Mesorhizobium robiniae]|uniref:SpoVK/Ycf46/Vps4 family AAA+-type ATPase n=1 Tax=Mesorhizobium robiniae TaxID=559315 RepID=A0ABV2GZ88_9HYPH|nr:ATP-binding protein [Mesorhizobium sp. ZC-5]MCV3243575.1 ATP-binding protein [Mesorhizobium sp. ZC-5]